MQTTVIEDAEEASLSVAAVCEMAATMNETYEKMMRIPMHLYGEYYLHEKAKHDPTPVTMRHDGWKMQEWDESFESLRARCVFRESQTYGKSGQYSWSWLGKVCLVTLPIVRTSRRCVPDSANSIGGKAIS